LIKVTKLYIEKKRLERPREGMPLERAGPLKYGMQGTFPPHFNGRDSLLGPSRKHLVCSLQYRESHLIELEKHISSSSYLYHRVEGNKLESLTSVRSVLCDQTET
jgi:hypothetical protein